MLPSSNGMQNSASAPPRQLSSMRFMISVSSAFVRSGNQAGRTPISTFHHAVIPADDSHLRPADPSGKSIERPIRPGFPSGSDDEPVPRRCAVPRVRRSCGLGRPRSSQADRVRTIFARAKARDALECAGRAQASTALSLPSATRFPLTGLLNASQSGVVLRFPPQSKNVSVNPASRANRLDTRHLEWCPGGRRHCDGDCDLEGRVIRGRALAESILERRTRGARPSKPIREFHYGIPCPLQWVEAPRGRFSRKARGARKGGTVSSLASFAPLREQPLLRSHNHRRVERKARTCRKPRLDNGYHACSDYCRSE